MRHKVKSEKDMKEKMIKKQPIADSRWPLARHLTAEKGSVIARDEVPWQSHRKGGFTMIEMLVAIVVLALGIMAVSGIFPLSLRVAQKMRTITKGTAYAHQKLEELRTLPYNHPLLDAGNSTIANPPETLENNFIRQSWVDGNIPIDGMRRIRVEVKWSHPLPDSVKIYTYITRN